MGLFKSIFNREEHKEGAKVAKFKMIAFNSSRLCD